MFCQRITTLFLFISALHLFNALPVVPGNSNSIFRLFYEKPDLTLIQRKLIQATNPQPVVDPEKPAAACCNTQQHLAGKKILGVYENISSALATAAQVPTQAKNGVGAAISNTLNNIGAKIVGFQK